MMKIFRIFWFFFVFEITRYVIFDIIVFCFYRIKKAVLRNRWEAARLKLKQQNPLVSIIAPGKNEGKHITSLAHSLSEQTYKNIEIIIIDDGSDDDTPQICRQLLREGKISKYLRNDIRGGKASAANFGLQQTKGRFIIHVDVDCSFDRDAIENILIPFFVDSRIGAVSGNVKVKNPTESVCSALQAIEYLKTVTIGRLVGSTIKTLRIISGAFGAFRKDILERIGGWDIGPGLDGDVVVKIRKIDFAIYMEPKAVCYTSPPENFKALTKQRLRWSRSLVRFRMRKHRDIFFPTANFRFSTFLGFMENRVYNVLLDIKWIVYAIDIMIHFPSTAKYIFPLNYLLYTMSNVVQFMVIISLSERKKDELKLAPYLLLMPLYIAIYMRAVRTYAYIQEFFFRVSYKDPWNPRKVSEKAEELRI
ncbi:MAG: glycosyltransferase [Candidatus Omnitrophica bacterium]|nr:glycosyltransferase [Candidatus Omnitrophota bacterium]